MTRKLSYWRMLALGILDYVEIRINRTVTWGGGGETNRVTWDEFSVLPFWQSLPYRFYLKGWDVSDHRKRMRRGYD